MNKLLNWLSLLLAVAVVHAASISPSKPSVDPFYDAPSGYESHPNGAILKWRTAPALGTTEVPLNLAGAWQVLVKTEDGEGNPLAIVSTIMEPYNADKKKVLHYSTMEDSANVDCAPSYSLEYGSNFNTIIDKLELYGMQIALEQGWYVVTSDYEGPTAAFTAGRQAGKAVLDSFRAVLSSVNTTGISSDAKHMFFGYSGGSFATGFAAALQPTYAPELKDHILGAAIGGFVTNLTSVVEAVEGTFAAGISALGFKGLSNAYPAVGEAIKDYMDPTHYEFYSTVSDGCLLNEFIKFTFAKYFTGPDPYFPDGWSIFSNETVNATIYSNMLAINSTTEIPEIPLFIFHGKEDEIAPYLSALRAYNNWCDWSDDISIEFAADDTTGHITEIPLGWPAAFAWLKKIFDGESPITGCKKTERLSNLLYPGVDVLDYYFLKGAVDSLFGTDVGPNGENAVIDGVALNETDSA